MGLIFKNVDVEIDLRYVDTSPLVSWNLGLMSPMFEADGRSLNGSTNRGLRALHVTWPTFQSIPSPDINSSLFF
jgi:hypothetical protein